LNNSCHELHPNWICNDILNSVVLKPGPVDLGLESGQIDKKIGKIMTRCDPVDPSGWPGDLAKPGQKPSSNPLAFVFFIKTMLFWIFLKIKIDRADPATWSKPKIQTLNQSGFKNYDRLREVRTVDFVNSKA
jgi:hypothetical protein